MFRNEFDAYVFALAVGWEYLVRPLLMPLALLVLVVLFVRGAVNHGVRRAILRALPLWAVLAAVFSPAVMVPLLEALRAAPVPGGILAVLVACVLLAILPALVVGGGERRREWIPAGIVGIVLLGIAALLSAPASTGRADYVTPLVYPLVAPALALGLCGALIPLLARHGPPEDSTESLLRRFSVLGVLAVAAAAFATTGPAFNTMQLCRFQRTVADLAVTTEVQPGVPLATLESEFSAALTRVIQQKDEASKDAYRELRLRRWHPAAVLAWSGYRQTYFDGTGLAFKYPEHDPEKLGVLARRLFLEHGALPSRAVYARVVAGGAVRAAEVRDITLDDLPHGYRKATRAVTWNTCVPGLRRPRQVELFDGQRVKAIAFEYGTARTAERMTTVYTVSEDGERWQVIGSSP